MARSGITYFQVVQAATQMVGEGRNPTVDGIRTALGGTGSKSTIAPLLKRWKAEHADLVAEADTGLPAELVQAVKGVHEKVQAEAARQREQQQQTHEAELHAVHEQLHSLQAEQAALKEQHQSQTQSLEAAMVAIQQLEAIRHDQAVALAGLRSENTGLEQRLAERSAEATTLAQQLTQARGQFDHYQEAVARQRTQEREDAQRCQERLEQELSQSRQRELAQQALLSEAQAQVQHHSGENERLEQTIQATEGALASAHARHDQAACQLTELAQRYRELEQHHSAAREAQAECSTILAATDKERTLLREQLERTEDRLALLTQEKIGLLQDKAVLSAQLRQYQIADPSLKTPP